MDSPVRKRNAHLRSIVIFNLVFFFPQFIWQVPLSIGILSVPLRLLGSFVFMLTLVYPVLALLGIVLSIWWEKKTETDRLLRALVWMQVFIWLNIIAVLPYAAGLYSDPRFSWHELWTIMWPVLRVMIGVPFLVLPVAILFWKVFFKLWFKWRQRKSDV